FQAEDGIRDFHVTGVQTCALPISTCAGCWPRSTRRRSCSRKWAYRSNRRDERGAETLPFFVFHFHKRPKNGRNRDYAKLEFLNRSEERRVGKECRSRRKRYDAHRT